MSERDELNYDYHYHPEDIPGHDEVPDMEELWEEILREECGED